jgi:hypothetical protein
MNHKQKVADFKIQNCQGTIIALNDCHSNAFYLGGLSVDNFVFSPESKTLEYMRQRQDFSKETIITVAEEWRNHMCDSDNFGKMVGLTKCTKKKAEYLSKLPISSFI